MKLLDRLIVCSTLLMGLYLTSDIAGSIASLREEQKALQLQQCAIAQETACRASDVALLRQTAPELWTVTKVGKK